jgi:hypothetical protein
LLILFKTTYAHNLGDNCIAFENFTASIGDFMVAEYIGIGQ